MGNIVGVPDDASAMFYNLTTLGKSDGGFVSSFPCGTPEPGTSTVNFEPNRNVPNLAMSKIGVGGVCFTTSVAIDIIVDVAGYVPNADGLDLLAQPVRAFDSRENGGSVAGRIRPGVVTEIDVAVPGAPAAPLAVIANFTQANPEGPGFAKLFPCGETEPGTSNLNWTGEFARANAVIVKVGAGNKICATTATATNLVLDVTGFITDEALYVPLSPIRLYDSRNNWKADCRLVHTFDGRAITIAEVSTGSEQPPVSVRTLQVPERFGFVGTTMRANTKLGRSCEEVLVVIVERNSDPLGILRLSFDGTAVLQSFDQLPKGFDPISAGGLGSLWGFGELADGSLFVHTGSGEIYKLEDGSLLVNLGSNPSRSVAVSPDGGTVAVRDFGDGRDELTLFNTDTGQVVSSVALPDVFVPGDIQFSPDGSRIVIDAGRIRLPPEPPEFPFEATFGLVVVYDAVTLEEIAFVTDRDGSMKPIFVGRGQIWLCTSDALFEWDLFVGVQPLARRDQGLFPPLLLDTQCRDSVR